MIMYLIDTDILIWTLRGKKIFEEILQKYKYRGNLSVSSLTIAEIYKNIFPVEYLKTERLLLEFDVRNVTSSIAKQGGLYWCQYIKSVRKLNIIDCIIAATAKEHSLTIMTLNTRHFPMRDIKVMDPLAKFSKKRN